MTVRSCVNIVDPAATAAGISALTIKPAPSSLSPSVYVVRNVRLSPVAERMIQPPAGRAWEPKEKEGRTGGRDGVHSTEDR